MGNVLEAEGFVESNISTWSDADYYRLLAELSAVFHARKGTPESDRCDMLCDLIEAYEGINYPMDTPSAGDSGEYRHGDLDVIK